MKISENETPDQPINRPNVKPPAAKSLRPWHYCVLAIPFLGLLWPAVYARWTPELFGIPFFYAYQFGWIFVSAGLTATVYRSITK
jgi:hypothetical protein